jgi:hypothetical protein
MFNIPTIQYPWLACKKTFWGVNHGFMSTFWMNKLGQNPRASAKLSSPLPSSSNLGTTWLASVEIYPGNQGFCAMFSRQILSKTFLGDFGRVADFKVL